MDNPLTGHAMQHTTIVAERSGGSESANHSPSAHRHEKRVSVAGVGTTYPLSDAA
jgi:hypothetical protein